MKMKLRLLSVIGSIAALSLLSVSVVSAHGAVDQEGWSETSSRTGACLGGAVTQTFTPAESTITGVDLGLTGYYGPSNANVTVSIRSGGVELGTVTSAVSTTTDLLTSVSFETAHFDFAGPISVVPGQTYSLTATSDADGNCDQMWIVGSYLYDGGYHGDDSEDVDLYFRTYAEVSDADGDGVPASEDCDDADANNFPSNAEVSDGQDNDCDGIVTKGDVLIESGVDSAGAGNAKGLLKSFNANSGAAGNAGKKS